MSTIEQAMNAVANDIETIPSSLEQAAALNANLAPTDQWVKIGDRWMTRSEAENIVTPSEDPLAFIDDAEEITEKAKTTHAYFDLLRYVQQVKAPEVASQMAQSVAFAVDVALVGAVRQLFKAMQVLHTEHDIDSISAMSVALRNREFTEQVMHDLAGKDDLQVTATILELTAVRGVWQELAKQLTALTYDYRGIPRNYVIIPIEEMLTREVKLAVKPMTERRIRTQVTRRAGQEGKDDIEKVIQRRLERERQRLEDTATALMDQSGALLTIYQLVMDDHEDPDFVDFHDMHPSLRYRMLEGALRGANRAEDFATSDSKMTDTEFDAVSFAVIKVERELKAVMQSPQFASIEA